MTFWTCIINSNASTLPRQERACRSTHLVQGMHGKWTCSFHRLNDLKMFYYRGLQQRPDIKGYLFDGTGLV